MLPNRVIGYKQARAKQHERNRKVASIGVKLAAAADKILKGVIFTGVASSMSKLYEPLFKPLAWTAVTSAVLNLCTAENKKDLAVKSLHLIPAGAVVLSVYFVKETEQINANCFTIAIAGAAALAVLDFAIEKCSNNKSTASYVPLEKATPRYMKVIDGMELIANLVAAGAIIADIQLKGPAHIFHDSMNGNMSTLQKSITWGASIASYLSGAIGFFKVAHATSDMCKTKDPRDQAFGHSNDVSGSSAVYGSQEAARITTNTRQNGYGTVSTEDATVSQVSALENPSPTYNANERNLEI